jgi:putative ABC transport system permease protein
MFGPMPYFTAEADEIARERMYHLRVEAANERAARLGRGGRQPRRNEPMRLLRNLGRRKVRTTLTILGITIGIWALVVFGSMANKIDALVAGGSTYYADKLTVSDAAGAFGGFASAPMSLSIADRLRELDGVYAVAPEVMLLMDDRQDGTASMSVPPMIGAGIPGADRGRESFKLTTADGRLITAQDDGSHVVVLGSDIARRHAKHVGDSIDLRGESFTVIGILEPTLTAPDQEAIVPFRTAQQMLVKSLPPLIGRGVSATEVASAMVVYPSPGVDPEALATEIKAAIPDVVTMTGKDFDQQVGSATATLNAILVGIALISLVVGGLSVVNTMAMSIAERTREIGIKRAIGGSRWRIVREFVTESALIGFIGGVIGLAFGALLVSVANEAGRSSGTVLFALTPATAVSAVAYATILGALAGLVPALNAARLDPVSALRYE